MADPQQALQIQIKNIEAKTCKSMAALILRVKNSKLTKHTEIVAKLKADLGLGHGDANTIAHLAKQDQSPTSSDNPLDLIYTGKKFHFAHFTNPYWIK